jgi:hypothetical protein
MIKPNPMECDAHSLRALTGIQENLYTNLILHCRVLVVFVATALDKLPHCSLTSNGNCATEQLNPGWRRVMFQVGGLTFDFHKYRITVLIVLHWQSQTYKELKR